MERDLPPGARGARAGLGSDVQQAAGAITDRLIAPGFAIEPTTTALLLNSLVSAFHCRRRIYLNAFQRSGEVLDHFGHRLQRLEFHVHSLDPWSMIPVPKAQDVIISLSGSLETEPVLVTLLHADREGLYRFVITAQDAEATRRQFQNVLPVHIPGVTSKGRSAQAELSGLLPLGSLFELRTFLYLEAVAEVLALCLEDGGYPIGNAPPAADMTAALMTTLGLVRERAGRVPAIMTALAQQHRQGIDELAAERLEDFVRGLLDAAHKGQTVYVTGFGRNNEIGGMFAHRLANMGIASAMTPSRLERPSEPGDLLFALSGSGGTYEVLQRLSGARQGGLRTAVFSAIADSPVVELADTAVILKAAIETRGREHFAEQRVKALPVRRPSESTFGLNALLTLEAVVAVVMREQGLSEEDLRHTDPWQGFDMPGAARHGSGA